MTTAVDSDALLQRYVDVLPAISDNELTLRLAALIESGCSIFRDAIDHARKMVRDQRVFPIIDTFRVDSDNYVIGTFSMPLLPIVPQEDYELFFSFMRQLTAWREELQTFCGE
jgi:hypothetical protein